jgi:hypothetical protein
MVVRMNGKRKCVLQRKNFLNAQSAETSPRRFQLSDLVSYFKAMDGPNMDELRVGDEVRVKDGSYPYTKFLITFITYGLDAKPSVVEVIDQYFTKWSFWGDMLERIEGNGFVMTDPIDKEGSKLLSSDPKWRCKIGQHVEGRVPLQLGEKHFEWWYVCKYCGEAIREFVVERADENTDPWFKS